MKRLAIIGGGITGLVAAYSLKGKYEVEIFEKGSAPGGIASTFDLNGVRIEKYYHHIFKSDNYAVNLCEELGIGSRLQWLNSCMGFFTDGEIYEFGTPVSLLKFKPLSLIDKFRFGYSILNIKLNNNWMKLEDITAKAWLMKYAGEKAYKVIWEPLLKTKFGAEHDQVSMAWMWGKIKLRGSSKDTGDSQEKLGYMDGSFGLLIDKLSESILEENNRIYTGTAVERITKANGKYDLQSKDQIYAGYDAVLSTVAYPIFTEMSDNILNEEYKKKLNSIKYTSTRCMTLILKESFMPLYWLNNGDTSIPFGGLIEHTNLLDKRIYGNKNILYISNYLFDDDDLYNCTDEQLLDVYVPCLQKINKGFNKEWVEDMHVYKDQYAQPIITKHYSRSNPDFDADGQGMFVAAMPQIYPEDRGINYAVRLGKQVAEYIENHTPKHPGT